MPRFLNAYTGEFVWIAEVGATPYAILSHTWRSAEDGGEQTFDDLIKRACEVARKTGFRLIWIDSCCIDKRSSAELSEAINSMYALYRDADVCYVHLADVSHGTDPRAKNSEFWKSRWHKRGWTLQELIAPAYVVFLTCDWTYLGTKTGLASTLEKITRIDATILLGLKPVASASVAKRMSWAAKRETTRVEDRAYSLLGIFGVHMSPIYGEGTNAFLRLQEEIIKHIPDQSVFAWGVICTLLALDEAADEPLGHWYERDYGLLAPSPYAFWNAGDITPITPFEFALRMGRPRNHPPPPLHCVFTPQGARIELMNIPLPPRTAEMLLNKDAVRCANCRVAIARSPCRRLALLRCTDRDGHLIALPLRCGEEDVGAAENVATGVHPSCGDWGHQSPRVLRLPAAVLNDVGVAPTCVEVSLLRRWQEPVKPKARRDGFWKETLHSPMWLWRRFGTVPEIRLASTCEEELGSDGFTLTPLTVESDQSEGPLPAELTVTTTLTTNAGDQHMHAPPMLIEVELRPPEQYRMVPGHFSVDFLHSLGPSEIEPADPASPGPDFFSSGHSLHHKSCHTPPTAGNARRQSRSFDIDLWSTSRTIAEAEFVIPDCTVGRTDAGGASVNHCVQLLRLKLEHPLVSAYVVDCDHLLLSVELSERFTSTISASSDDCADRLSLAQASTAEISITQDGPSPGPDSTLSPRYNAIRDSPEPAFFLTATSEQTAVREEPGVPLPCDAEISDMDDGPGEIHTDGPDSVIPSPLHEIVQEQSYPDPATPPTVASEHSAVYEEIVGRALGSANIGSESARLSEPPTSNITATGMDTACLQDVSDETSTNTGGMWHGRGAYHDLTRTERASGRSTPT
ncbi:hypothetical protein C2E23DRAFT_763555 [Lenzites betulinus]|nr:hypothetical protein C2E23DRAFT_763555 [Lenzites betulinus]